MLAFEYFGAVPARNRYDNLAHRRMQSTWEITFTGTDTLRIADGKLAEYWADADSSLFYQ